MSTSTQVYVQDKTHGWLPASVVSSDEKVSQVKVSIPGEKDDNSDDTLVEREVKLKDYSGGNLPLQNVNENGLLIEMADMCDLPYLHEAAIVYNLRARHRQKNPYTRVGDIVIAVNPFQWIGHLYSEKNRETYADKLIWNGNDGDGMAGLPPHVYESSSLAYRGLAVDGQDQAILVSGESGAGKTETVKIVMSHVASVQSSTLQSPESSADDGGVNISQVVKRVLDSNPLLEAFGNAKTTRNDNSSRFGKYIQLQFDVEDATTAAFSGKSVPSCILAGSFCETYLLEKTRVVVHEAPERTYHIFYQILAAPEEVKSSIWTGLSNTKNSSFKFVGDTETLKIEGKTDGEHWQRTVNALKLIGIDGENLNTLMRAVCTVLQLGNLTFEKDPSNDDNSIITSTAELEKLSELIGVAADDVKNALTSRTVIAGKEIYTVPLNAIDARDTCNAFAKEIYQQLFDWLVKSINAATSAEKNYEDAKDVEEFGLIGLLDIFGFESFKVNRFEQLCINYANEKLQQKYTIDIFRSVQEEYEYEGIELGEVAFSDNVEVLKLVEGRMGIIAVLNEECVRPRGNDISFVSKVKTMNKDLVCLTQDRLHRPEEFAIEHYAGLVKYNATNFVQKNMDSIPNDLLDCACKSSNLIIGKELKAAADARAGSSTRGKKSKLTVATKFRSQLTQLMTNISKTRTRYIRCIKPNPEKKPLKFHLSSSVQQLRCAGVVAAVTISRVAFPNRLTHETVIDRFRCLSPIKIEDSEEKKDDGSEESPMKNALDAMLSDLLKSMEVTKDGKTEKVFVMGKTRVYFRVGALEFLESQRLVALGILATSIQRVIRGFVAMSVYTRLKSTAIVTQALRRRTKARNDFLKMRASCIMVECWARCVSAKDKLFQLKKENRACKIQSRWRMVVAKTMFIKIKKAAVMIQKISRGSMQRPKYKIMLKEAAEEARVNSKLAALQKRLADAEMKWIQADKARIVAEKKAAGVESNDAEPVPAPITQATVEPRSEEESTLKGISLQQKALIDESGKMLEYLRNEVFKIRGKNYLLRTDLNKLKEDNHHITEHSASVTASFEALKQHANQLSKTNMKLIVDSTTHKEVIAKLKVEVKNAGFSSRMELSKLREELKRKDIEQAEEIARLKKEYGTKKTKKSNKKEAVSKKETTSSLKKYVSYNKGINIDAEEEWGQEYYSNNSNTKKSKGRGSGKSSVQSRENTRSGRGVSSKGSGGRGSASTRKSNAKRPMVSNNSSRSYGNSKSSTNNTKTSRASPQAQSSLKAKSSLAKAKSSLAAAASEPKQPSAGSQKLIASTRSLSSTIRKTSSLSKAAGK